jgi:transketolase
MRKQFIKTVENILQKDEKTVLLLGDISVFGFRNSIIKYPSRVYNTGILEQSMIGLSSGLSLSGMTPIIHTIAPFLVERAYEQLKLDFGYQNLNGNFISIGASYDYAGLGSSHNCPADVNILKQIPNMEIILPGTSQEFDVLFNQSYNNGNPTYYRLSEYENINSQNVKFGAANIIKKGSQATIIVVGNMLDLILESTSHLDVTILYYTTIHPFDKKTLSEFYNKNIILCEPYYEGGLDYNIIETFKNKPISIKHIGIPHKFLDSYGNYNDINNEIGFTVKNISRKVENFIYGNF